MIQSMKPTATERDERVYQAVLSGELEIDSLGRIWRVKKRGWDRWKEQVVSRPCLRVRAENDTGEYLQIRVMVNLRRDHTSAHRLVYRHFHGPIPAGLTVNHKDGKKKRNLPGNLELATYSEQQIHALHILKVGRTDQRGIKNAMAKLTPRKIKTIRRRRLMGERLLSIAKDFNISFQAVSKIARGQRWAQISG